MTMVSVVSVMQEIEAAAAQAEQVEPRSATTLVLAELAARTIQSRFGTDISTRTSPPGAVDARSPEPVTDLVVPMPQPAATTVPPEPTEEAAPTSPVASESGDVAAAAGSPSPTSAPSTGVSAMSFGGHNILGINLARLPQSGAAYERVKALAAQSGSLNYGDNNGPNNDVLLAKAALGDKAGVLAMVRAAKGSLTPNIIHNAAARNLAATAIALSLVSAHEEDGWLLMAREMAYDGGQQTLLYAAGRSNNHGSAADQSLVAIDMHLNDRAHLESRVIPIIRQRLGDEMGISLRFGESVQADPANPVTIGLPGTFADGVSLDGLLLEEQRRESGFPNCGGYNFGASGQILISVWLLEVAGYNAQEWGQRAIHRVFARLVAMGCAPEGDDRWQGHMYNALAGRAVLPEAVGDGKTLGITDYLFSGR
ncbi:MAG: hypothetical protein M3153_08425 [Chloroflexota bacterium]|nr:hypothetical protein [Chloroflexota bacterium]